MATNSGYISVEEYNRTPAVSVFTVGSCLPQLKRILVWKLYSV